MKAWSRFLGVASALALAGLAAAACDGPTIIIQNVVGDAGGVAPGDVDAGADAAEVPDADVDAGEAITACTPGTVTAKPTPLYLELVVSTLKIQTARADITRAVDRLSFDDPHFGLGFKPTADPDVDDAVIRAATRDGGSNGAEAYQQLLRDFPSMLTDVRFGFLDGVIRRAASAPEARRYGTHAQYEQLREWYPSHGLATGGRRAMLVVAADNAKLWTADGSGGFLQATREYLATTPVLTGVVDVRTNLSWPAGVWETIAPELAALGMHGDPECAAMARAPGQRPAGTPLPYGAGRHPLCVPTIYSDESGDFQGFDISDAIGTVAGQLRACEYEVHGFDARVGGSLKMTIKAPDGYEQRIYALQDADAGRVTAGQALSAQPPGFVLDDAVHPTKVTVTGEACLELRRDQARTLEITTGCP